MRLYGGVSTKLDLFLPSQNRSSLKIAVGLELQNRMLTTGKLQCLSLKSKLLNFISIRFHYYYYYYY
jgi:hypothetical protein